MTCTCEGYGVYRYGRCQGTHTRTNELFEAVENVLDRFVDTGDDGDYETNMRALRNAYDRKDGE